MSNEPHRKRLGLIGGLDATAPVNYWHAINQEVQFHAGPDCVADLLLSCGAVEQLRHSFRAGDWRAIGHRLGGEALRLAAAGAEALVVCDTALSPITADLARIAGIPAICMGQSVADTLRTCRLRTSAILGVSSGMEEQMWRDALPGVTLVQPMMAERLWLDGCLESPVSPAHVPPQWKREVALMIDELKRAGAQSVILANPALTHYVSLSEAPLTVFNAAEIHAWAAASWALGLSNQRHLAQSP